MLHQASAMTHNNADSKLCCELYALMLRNIENGLGGQTLAEQLQAAVNDISLFYEEESEDGLTPEEIEMNREALAQRREVVQDYDQVKPSLTLLARLTELDSFKALPEEEIHGTEKAIDTLEAAVYCLLNTESYQACVLKAANLEGAAEAVSLLAGSLAGAFYGEQAVPEAWREKLMKGTWMQQLCDTFQKTWIA